MGTNKSAEEEQCCCVLTSAEIEVLRCIFEIILRTGKTPTIREMRLTLNQSDDYITDALDELEKKDILLRKKGTQEIISVYPLSITSTKHQIILENKKKLFAMCAVDALGMPIMFNKKAKIVSKCEKCKQEITIEIEKEKIAWVSHPNIVIWSPGRQVAPAAETCCPSVNFFCSREHLHGWTEENPDLVGKISAIRQAFPRIKRCWRLYGETLGLR
jgi:DNA-binding MarR family transcriptional regulator